jgi:hypothetical protein
VKAARNVWLEFTALCLFVASLPFLLIAAVAIAQLELVRHAMLPSEPPLERGGLVAGHEEAVGGTLFGAIPATVLIGTACGLRFLLVEEEEPEE